MSTYISDLLTRFTDSDCLLLSPLGRTLVREMNRLGIFVDLSHTSDATAVQALALSEAPVIWSHSSARAVWDVPRNVPDYILQGIGLAKGKRDAVVMVCTPIPSFYVLTVMTMQHPRSTISDLTGKFRPNIRSSGWKRYTQGGGRPR
jgi:microsomal dipeptidase-like Zn-dependent dipeptidase